MKKGTIAATTALLAVAGIIGWRILATADGGAGEAVADAGSVLPASLEELLERAEADPGNAAAWQELGLAYFGANMFPEAVSAYERAVAADAETAVLWSSLGEARVMASEREPLPEAALEAFRRALALDNGDPRARYFLAVEKDLAGDHQGAVNDWLALLADTPPGAAWENDLVRTIQQVATLNEIAVEDRIASAASARDLLPPGALDGPRGPTQEQMAAASSIPIDQQQSMAEGMVANLSNRIDAQGGSVEEWVMLMRSYQQLGRLGEARRTRDRAIAAHPDAAEQITAVADQLGVGRTSN